MNEDDCISSDVNNQPYLLKDEVLNSSLVILSPSTHAIISSLLDSTKILLSTEGLHRDWRGLAEFSRHDVSSISSSSRISLTSHCLHLWRQAGGKVLHLINALQAMDRYDVICDAKSSIDSDYEKILKEGFPYIPLTLQENDSIHNYQEDNILTIQDSQSLMNGGTLTYYDALVLHSDEDQDFVKTLIDNLEGKHGLKLCIKDRDLIGGLQFESASVITLIKERCQRVVVLLSKSFIQSPQNKFFTLFAHALSIEERRRIVIPCLIEPCEKPAVIHFCHTLDYFRAHGYWDYWQKLHDSITARPDRQTKLSLKSSVQIEELPPDQSIVYSDKYSLPAIEYGDSHSKDKKSSSRIRTVSGSFNKLFSKEGKKKKKKTTLRSASESLCDSKSPVPLHSTASSSVDSQQYLLLPDVPKDDLTAEQNSSLAHKMSNLLKKKPKRKAKVSL